MLRFMIYICLVWSLVGCQSAYQTSYSLQKDSSAVLDLRSEKNIIGSSEEFSRLYHERVKNQTNGKIILKKTAYPKYPPSALDAGIEGTVITEFIVNKKGRVAQIVVIQSAGKDLDKASIDCLKRWQFEPFLQNGKPIDAKFRHIFDFVIEK